MSNGHIDSVPPIIECEVRGDSYVLFCDYCQRNHIRR